MPKTTACTECLAANGDVPRLRKYDEFLPTGEEVETYFTRDHYVEQQLKHRNRVGPMVVGSLDRPAREASMSLGGVPLSQAVLARSEENAREADEDKQRDCPSCYTRVMHASKASRDKGIGRRCRQCSATDRARQYTATVRGVRHQAAHAVAN